MGEGVAVCSRSGLNSDCEGAKLRTQMKGVAVRPGWDGWFQRCFWERFLGN